jgi:hypothetical protein
MSTDFLVSLPGGKSTAISVKYAKAVSDRRVLEKLQIEQEYWRRQDTEWKLATESDIPQTLLDNIEWVQEAGENPHPDNDSKAAEPRERFKRLLFHQRRWARDKSRVADNRDPLMPHPRHREVENWLGEWVFGES